MIVEVGQQLDRYRVEGELGAGGMATVYRVVHQELGTPHALKVLHIHGKSLQERILTEGRAQARLKHPNVVAVTDVIRVGGAPGLVMEFVDGPALDQMLAAYRPNLDQVDDLGRSILSGVAAAHRSGLIHRDLKPGNVMLAIEGSRVVPKVTDFGLAKVVFGATDSKLRTVSGTAMGTPTFMAPEQFRDASKVDLRADVFSLGAILFELVTGVPAFARDELPKVYDATLNERYRQPRSLVPNIPRRFEAAIQGALRADPALRIGTVDQLLEVWSGNEPVRSAAWEPEHLALLRALTRPTDAPTSNATLDVPLDAGPAEPAAAPDPVALGIPDRPASPGLPVAAWVGLVVLALLALGVSVLAVLAVVQLGLPGDPAVPEPAAADVAPEPVPVAPSSAPSPVGSPETAPSTGPVPSPRPGPRPPSVSSAPAPTAEPEVRVTELPDPVVVVTEQPAPAPRPSPAPRLAPGATVNVVGVDRAVLVAHDGTLLRPGRVPPGHYTVSAYFDAATATDALSITVADGETRLVRCAAAMRVCQ